MPRLRRAARRPLRDLLRAGRHRRPDRDDPRPRQPQPPRRRAARQGDAGRARSPAIIGQASEGLDSRAADRRDGDRGRASTRPGLDGLAQPDRGRDLARASGWPDCGGPSERGAPREAGVHPLEAVPLGAVAEAAQHPAPSSHRHGRGEGRARPRLRAALPRPPARRLLLLLLPRRQPPRRRGPHRAGLPPGLPALRARPARVDGRPLRPWLIRIAHNLASNYHRDRARKPQSPLDNTDPIAAPHGTERIVEGRAELQAA